VCSSDLQIFLNNTGSWSRRRLFYNLDFNLYKPAYSRGLVDDVVQSVGGGIANLFGLSSVGGYYVGTQNLDPSRINSPVGEVPINQFGDPNISNVYGPEKLSKDFERQEFNFGFGGKSSTDADGAIDGGFVWTSPKYKDNAGFKVKPGGEIGGQDVEFPQISARYEQNTSSEKDFKKGSILDSTQRIIDSQPQGKNRLSHAGNAIDQVSKVFNDGYKEITKGSKVKSYLNSKGEPIIINKQLIRENEYCRIFAKDIPYYTYNDLQKKDRLYRSIEGLTTYSIMDNVYNLNIAPTESNFSKGGFAEDGGRFVKKYMFSIENLAWRTSNRPNYRVSDLPECERGPNGGRVMWFPPYNLSFSESVNTTWNSTTFLGRPEPVYTYKDTNRTGTLSFSVVVDHPSILNLIVNKYLEKVDPDTVNSIVDSFFAGCVKYDLYELAKIYNTIPPDQLIYFQEILGDPRTDITRWTEIIEEIPSTNPTKPDPEPVDIDFTQFEGLSFYFDNDIPKPNQTVGSFSTYFVNYKSTSGKYVGSAATFFSEVIENNYDVIETGDSLGFSGKIKKYLDENKTATMKIKLIGSASSPATETYNLSLGDRRIDSVINYLKAKGLTEYIDNKRLIFERQSTGELTSIPVSGAKGSDKTKNYIGNPINCTTDLSKNDKIYSVQAAACRSVKIDSIAKQIPPVIKPTPQPPIQKEVEREKRRTFFPRKKEADYRGLTKRVIRHLLSECDYFKMVQAENPFIYNSMKEKIKYFNPTFHSTTPEGLNARLTFLQQCMRPGDTIPTIGTDGTLIQNDAYNTAFGSPPVLVLRIGDFYNTKVLCNSLQISFEPLIFDLNPEGIGVQPQIAKITMGITFIGGSGLKEPIEQLQNALSFNYYANTEIYDDRAEATEDTLEFDKKFYEDLKAALEAQQEEKTQEEPPKEGGEAIGDLQAKSLSAGTINYKNIMNKLAKSSNEYYINVFNKLQEVVDKYNYGILQIYNENRNYSNGNFFEFNSSKTKSEIFGRSSQYEQKIIDAQKQLIKRIENDDLPIIKELNRIKDIRDDDVRSFKLKLKEFLNDKVYPDYITQLSNIDSQMSKNQIDLVTYISKINYVMTDRDGKVSKDGVPTVYKISADTKIVDAFKSDFKNISSGMTNFLETLEKEDLLTKPKDYDNPDSYKVLIGNSAKVKIKDSKDSVSFKDDGEKNFYLLLNRVILDENQRNSLINLLTQTKNANSKTTEPSVIDSYNRFKSMVANCLNARADLYKQEDLKSKELFEKNKQKYQNPQVPFAENIERVFDYEIMSSPSDKDRERLIGLLYTTINLNNDNKTFNGKKKFQ
jgi:hypothetical protein